MSLFPHIIKEKKNIIKNIIKENIIKKLQKLYSPSRNPKAGNKSSALFAKKPLCKGDLSPARKIFIERPETCIFTARHYIRRHDIRRSGLPPIKQFVLSKYKPHSEITTNFCFFFINSKNWFAASTSMV